MRRPQFPDIVWFVLIVGGAPLTVAFGSFLGAPSLRMQLRDVGCASCLRRPGADPDYRP